MSLDPASILPQAYGQAQSMLGDAFNDDHD
jgi:hypothetical protein